MSLELHQLDVSLKRRSLFAPVSLVIEAGEIATVMGPSGCGKSTLLAAVSGSLSQEFAVAGDILLDGVSVKTRPLEKRRIGILFQDDLLFPHLSVRGNLAFALPPGMPKKEKATQIQKALQSAGLSGFEKRDPATLSGGQRSRISLLRALLAQPKALLLDEPFSKLDMELREQIRQFVFECIRKMAIPALLVTHDPKDCPGGKMIQLGQEAPYGPSPTVA